MKFSLLFLLLFSELTFACSCVNQRQMDEVVKNSSVVFYGEVIGVEAVEKLVKYGEDQKYRVTVRPVNVFKGNAKRKYEFKAQQWYGGRYNPDSEVEEITVGGCGLDLLLGDEYVIFIENGKKHSRHWGWCSEHILPIGTDRYNYFFDEIEPKL